MYIVYLGVQTLVPPELLTLWDEYELELLLCGIRQYNLDQLKDNHAIVGVQTLRFTYTHFFLINLAFSYYTITPLRNCNFEILKTTKIENISFNFLNQIVE